MTSAAKTDLVPYFKAIDEGRLQDIDIDDFEAKFYQCAAEAGDHLQFKLHKYCKQDEDNKKNVSIIISLSKICYCNKSVLGFTNMDRFLGCVYHIVIYLLKHEKHEEALDVFQSLSKQNNLIEEAVSKSETSRNIVNNLHIQLINSANKLLLNIKSKNDSKVETTHELAKASMGVLRLLPKKSNPPKNLLRNMKYYFNNLKYFKDKNVRIMYDCFMECLEYFDPKFQRDQFLCYYISEMSRVDSTYDEKQINEWFKHRVNLFSLFIKESDLMKHWNVVIDFFINEIKSSDMESVVEAFEKIRKNGSKLNMLVKSIIFNSSMQLWYKLHSEKWSEKFSVEFVQRLFDGILLPLRCKLGNVTEYCSTSTFNTSVCLSDLFNLNLQTIFYTIRLCFKNNISNSLMLVDVLRRAFKLFKECMEEMTRNKCCFSKRKHCWSATIIHYTNTIEDLLRESTKKCGWDYLRNCSRELISEIIQSDFEIPFERKRLAILFQRWHYANMKLQDFRESLFVSAVYLSAYPSDVEEALGLWLETKMQIYDEKIEDVTIADILESECAKIKSLCPNFDLGNQNFKSLLLKELKAYNSCSFSNFRKTSLLYYSVNRIWSQLQKLNLEIHEKALVLNCVIEMTVSSGDTDSRNHYQEECNQMIELLMKKEKKFNSRNLFYAGNLKFSLFQLNLKSIQQSENSLKSDDVLDYLKKEEEEKAKFGEEIDLNLTCNILPSSNNLNVELEEKYLSALNGIVEIWQKAAKHVAKGSLEEEEIKSWLYNVKQVASMFQLVGDYYQGLLAWILYYKIGKIFDDTSAQLLGISSILEECTHVDKCNLLQEADAMAEELVKDEKHREIVLKFWLTMASKHLKKRNDFDCFRYISKAKTVLESLKKLVNIYIYNAKFWCLTSHFLCLFPDYSKDFQFSADPDVRVIINKAFGYISSGIKNEASKSFSQTEYTELMLTLIETSMWAVEYFGFYQQTNYMRLFLDDLYQIAQKLVLPTRTAEILVKLAEVDILCEKFEDCQEKLNKLKSILMIDSIKCIEPEPFNNEYLKIPKTHPEEAISPRALSPVRFVDKDTKYRERDVSPRFINFKSRNHSRKCECVLCRNILIQLLTIDTLAIEGQYHTRKSQLKKAYYCYRSGYDNLKRLEWNQFNQTQKITGEINLNMKQFTGNLDFKIDVIRFRSAKFLINYAYFELSPGVKGDVAMDVNKLIERVGLTLENLSFELKLLQWRFLELKITALVVAKERKKIISSPVLSCETVSVSTPTPTATPAVSHIPRRNLAPNKYRDVKNTRTPRDSKTKGRKVLEDSDEDMEEVKKPPTPTETPEVLNNPKKSLAPYKYKDSKSLKAPRELKTKGRKVLDESDEDEGAKKAETDVSVDLFESFEEKLKLSQETEKKKKVLKQKSESVEIIEVKGMSTRSRNK